MWTQRDVQSREVCEGVCEDRAASLFAWCDQVSPLCLPGRRPHDEESQMLHGDLGVFRERKTVPQGGGVGTGAPRRCAAGDRLSLSILSFFFCCYPLFAQKISSRCKRKKVRRPRNMFGHCDGD